MKLLLIATILTLSAPLQAQAPANTAVATGVIDGKVVHAGSLDPIGNAQVTLIKPNPSGGTLTPEAASALESIQSLTTSLVGISQASIDTLIASQEKALGLTPGTLASTPQSTVLTNASGSFTFKDLAPGKYSIRVTSEGYFGLPLNGTSSTSVSKTITIDAKKPTPFTDVVMVKGGIVSGRIKDPSGQPASGVAVGFYRLSYGPSGRPVWLQVNSKPTDDRGEYRMFWLAPGEYFVGITPRAAGIVSGPQDSWLRTFFPGVSDTTAASTIRVKDGGEVPGVDFSIQSGGIVAVFKVSGKAVNPLPNVKPNPTTNVMDRTVSTFVLAPREPGVLDGTTPPQSQNSLPLTARPNNEFEIRNVRPGAYDLYTLWMDSAAKRYYTSRTPIEIRNSDIDNLNLSINPGVPLSGEIRVSGISATPLPFESIKINLRVLDTTPGPFASIIGAIPVDAAGKFSIPDVPEARYTIQLTGLPDSTYVADIRQGATSVYDSGFLLDVTSTGPVQIVVSPAGQVIEGTVLNSQAKPASSATVVLVPPAERRMNAQLYKTASIDADGHFSIKGVPVGEFTLFAWENVASGAWMNTQFLTAYQDKGHPLNVISGSRNEVQLDLIPDAITPK
jgi:hypothetical protein